MVYLKYILLPFLLGKLSLALDDEIKDIKNNTISYEISNIINDEINDKLDNKLLVSICTDGNCKKVEVEPINNNGKRDVIDMGTVSVTEGKFNYFTDGSDGQLIGYIDNKTVHVTGEEGKLYLYAEDPARVIACVDGKCSLVNEIVSGEALDGGRKKNLIKYDNGKYISVPADIGYYKDALYNYNLINCTSEGCTSSTIKKYGFYASAAKGMIECREKSPCKYTTVTKYGYYPSGDSRVINCSASECKYIDLGELTSSGLKFYSSYENKMIGCGLDQGNIICGNYVGDLVNGYYVSGDKKLIHCESNVCPYQTYEIGNYISYNNVLINCSSTGCLYYHMSNLTSNQHIYYVSVDKKFINCSSNGCSFIAADDGYYVSGEKKLFSCNSNVCTYILSNVNGYYISSDKILINCVSNACDYETNYNGYYSSFDKKMITCSNNKCSTTTVGDGYYISGNTKLINCLSSVCTYLEVMGKYYVSTDSKMIECNNDNGCTIVNATNGFYASGDNKLISCSSNVCTYEEFNAGYYISFNKKLIYCDNSSCINSKMYFGFLNSYDKTVIWCNNTECQAQGKGTAKCGENTIGQWTSDNKFCLGTNDSGTYIAVDFTTTPGTYLLSYHPNSILVKKISSNKKIGAFKVDSYNIVLDDNFDDTDACLSKSTLILEMSDSLDTECNDKISKGKYVNCFSGICQVDIDEECTDTSCGVIENLKIFECFFEPYKGTQHYPNGIKTIGWDTSFSPISECINRVESWGNKVNSCTNFNIFTIPNINILTIPSPSGYCENCTGKMPCNGVICSNMRECRGLMSGPYNVIRRENPVDGENEKEIIVEAYFPGENGIPSESIIYYQFKIDCQFIRVNDFSFKGSSRCRETDSGFRFIRDYYYHDRDYYFFDNNGRRVYYVKSTNIAYIVTDMNYGYYEIADDNSFLIDFNFNMISGEVGRYYISFDQKLIKCKENKIGKIVCRKKGIDFDGVVPECGTPCEDDEIFEDSYCILNNKIYSTSDYCYNPEAILTMDEGYHVLNLIPEFNIVNVITAESSTVEIIPKTLIIYHCSKNVCTRVPGYISIRDKIYAIPIDRASWDATEEIRDKNWGRIIITSNDEDSTEIFELNEWDALVNNPQDEKGYILVGKGDTFSNNTPFSNINKDNTDGSGIYVKAFAAYAYDYPMMFIHDISFSASERCFDSVTKSLGLRSEKVCGSNSCKAYYTCVKGYCLDTTKRSDLTDCNLDESNAIGCKVGYYLAKTNTKDLVDNTSNNAGDLYECIGSSDNVSCTKLTGNNIPIGYLVNRDSHYNSKVPMITCSFTENGRKCTPKAITQTSCGNTPSSDVATGGNIFKNNNKFDLCLDGSIIATKGITKTKYFMEATTNLGIETFFGNYIIVGIDRIGNVKIDLAIDANFEKYQYTNNKLKIIKRTSPIDEINDVCENSAENLVELVYNEWNSGSSETTKVIYYEINYEDDE